MDVLNVVKTPSFGLFVYNKIEMSKKELFCHMPAACLPIVKLFLSASSCPIFKFNF